MSSLMGSNPIPSAILRRKFPQFINVLCCPAPPLSCPMLHLRVDDTGARGGCNGASYAASASTRGWRVSGGLLQGGQPQSAREQMESPIGPGHLGLEAPGDNSLNDADLRGGRKRGARHAPPTWRNAKHAAQWESTLETYAVPGIGHLRAGEIAVADVLRVLTPICTAKPETARRVRQQTKAVMHWAIAPAVAAMEAE